jgi:hypothetical protein
VQRGFTSVATICQNILTINTIIQFWMHQETKLNMWSIPNPAIIDFTGSWKSFILVHTLRYLKASSAWKPSPIWIRAWSALLCKILTRTMLP